MSNIESMIKWSLIEWSYYLDRTCHLWFKEILQSIIINSVAIMVLIINQLINDCDVLTTKWSTITIDDKSMFTIFQLINDHHWWYITIRTRSDCDINNLIVDPPTISDHGLITCTVPYACPCESGVDISESAGMKETGSRGVSNSTVWRPVVPGWGILRRYVCLGAFWSLHHNN